MNTTTVLTEDLWAPLDALDAVPEAQQAEWYKRLDGCQYKPFKHPF